MAIISISNITMDYPSAQLVVTLDTPFTGAVGDKMNIKNAVSQRIDYTTRDANAKGLVGPAFDASIIRGQSHDASL